jgi:hypothetical protein
VEFSKIRVLTDEHIPLLFINDKGRRSCIESLQTPFLFHCFLSTPQKCKKAMHVGRDVALCSIIVSLATASGAAHPARVEVDDYRGFCACIILTSLNKTTNAFPAKQLLQNISDTLSTSDQDICNNWAADPGYEITVFSDRFGKPTTNISESAGVFAPDIYAFCGPPKFGQVRIH